MTTKTNEFTTAAGTVTINARGQVKKAGTAIGRVFANPDGGADFGYVTTDGTESPSWYANTEEAARALASRGGRGAVRRGSPSQRHVAAFRAVSRKSGATREQILDAIERATGVAMGAHLVAGLMAALRTRHDVAIDFDRATGRYTAA